VLYAYAAVMLAIVIGVPTALLFLLLYHGGKLDLAERKKARRGFEVKPITGESPVREEKET
jgi:hypothetical protein